MESKTIFPQLTMATEATLDQKPIKLDGQKVIFVKKTTLMPTEILDKPNKKVIQNGR